MRILIIGAGVLGCNMAHNFYVAGKDVTLFARGTWGQNIKERGLVIKNKFSLRSTCDKISVIDKLSKEDAYDVIFVCLRYTQLCTIIDTLKENTTKNIVFVGNNMDAEGLASKLMRPMLQFCDEEKMVAYLETNKETNVGLYRHYGFSLMKEEKIPKTPVTHYAMVRRPLSCKDE